MAAFAPGFDNPVLDSQATFRAIMRAMARPGAVMDMSCKLSPPAPLPVSAAAAVLALADFETPLWFSPSLVRDTAVVDYLVFHTGASLVQAQNQAAFALADLRKDELDLSVFAQGTAAYPDRGATVILIVDSLCEYKNLAVSGPGLRTPGQLGVSPLPADFPSQWASCRTQFPLGVDLVFTAGSQLACLPRSARLVQEAA